MQPLQQRFQQSLHLPTFQDWRQTAIMLGIYGAIALPIAYHAGLFAWSPWPIAQLLSFAGLKLFLGTLVLPVIAEEMIFRVFLIPHPSEKRRLRIVLLWLGLSLLLYVATHPLNAMTLYPRGNPTFLKPTFLGLAGLLGLACSMLYRQTGSLVTITVLHWVVVVVWLGWGGGEALLSQ